MPNDEKNVGFSLDDLRASMQKQGMPADMIEQALAGLMTVDKAAVAGEITIGGAAQGGDQPRTAGEGIVSSIPARLVADDTQPAGEALPPSNAILATHSDRISKLEMQIEWLEKFIRETFSRDLPK